MFEGIKAWLKLFPLSSRQIYDPKRLGEHAGPLEGMELLGQGCEFCFLFLVCQMQMVDEQRGSQEGVRRIGRTY